MRAGSSWWPRIRPSRRGDRDIDAGRAQVGDEDVAGVGAEGQLARRPAARARPDVALRDEAALEQLADPLGDDRAPQAGPRDELRARLRAAQADLVEDGDEGVERFVGERAVARQAGVGHGPMIRPVPSPPGSTFALDMAEVRSVANKASPGTKEAAASAGVDRARNDRTTDLDCLDNSIHS